MSSWFLKTTLNFFCILPPFVGNQKKDIEKHLLFCYALKMQPSFLACHFCVSDSTTYVFNVSSENQNNHDITWHFLDVYMPLFWFHLICFDKKLSNAIWEYHENFEITINKTHTLPIQKLNLYISQTKCKQNHNVL